MGFESERLLCLWSSKSSTKWCGTACSARCRRFSSAKLSHYSTKVSRQPTSGLRSDSAAKRSLLLSKTLLHSSVGSLSTICNLTLRYVQQIRANRSLTTSDFAFTARTAESSLLAMLKTATLTPSEWLNFSQNLK